MNKLILSIILLFIISTATSFSQDSAKINQRPKIGLVLSGGGAKGIAHIGILRAMEKEGLRPDYIAGTSMGSIIGGLFALGYTADQLDTIIRSTNWDLVLSNQIPLNYIAYEEKEYYNRYLFEFPIEKGKPKLPSGVIQGQTLGEMLARYCWPSKNYKNFDDFPIPFRCVATDISTGKPIVFKDGSLAMALRASMAIPTAFSPVDLDTTLVVDGGVVDNFPVEELYKMGADYVIGVNVSHGFQSAYEIENLMGILMQISMIPSSEKLEKQIEKCDLYIFPDLKNYGTASFGNYPEILNIGYRTGEMFRPKFKALADSIGINTSPKPNILLQPDSIIIGSIRVVGNKLVNKSLILSKLQIDPGDKVSRDDIEYGVRTIFGINNFKKIIYRLAPLPEVNQYELLIKIFEKKPASLKGSVHYDNIFGIGITLNLTLRNILGKSSRTLVAGDISENPKFRFNYLKYIGHTQRIALSTTYNYLNEEIPLYSEGVIDDIEISIENSISLGFLTTRSLKNSLFVGMKYQLTRQKQKFSSVLPEGIDKGNFNFASGEILFQANTFNDRNYPVRGREFAIGGELYFHSDYSVKYQNEIDTVYLSTDIDGTTIQIPFLENEFNEYIINPLIPNVYTLFQMSYTKIIPAGRKFQIIPSLNLGLTFSNDTLALFNTFRLGGSQRVKHTDVRFLGLNYAEVDYSNYGIGSILFQNVFLKNKIFLKYGANFLLPYDYVPLNDLSQFSFSKMIEENSMLGFGLEATYKSFIGPVSLGISRNTRDSYFRYYLAVGFSFNYAD